MFDFDLNHTLIAVPLRPLLVFLVVLARMAGLVTFAPVWNLPAAPRQFRILLALVLSWLLTPVVAPVMTAPPAAMGKLVAIMTQEVLLGLALGFVGRLALSSLDTAAHTLTSAIGFNLASTIDPNSRASTTALGSFAGMMGIMVLLGVDGHHWFLAALLESFRRFGPGAFAVTPGLLHLLVRLFADVIGLGLALAAPAVIVMLTVELTLAMVGRVAPQLQVLVFGFPIKIAVGFCLLGLTLQFLPGAFRHIFTLLRTALWQVVQS